MAQMEMVNNLPSGKATHFHPNGQIAHQGTFWMGEREGVFQFWNEQGVWLRKELFHGGERTWSTTERSEQPPDNLLASPKTRPRLLTKTEPEPPTFSGMRPLTLRDGITMQASYQQIERDNNKSRAHNFLLVGAHDLEFLGQPSLGTYGVLGMTSIEFGSQTADEVMGKRTLELGARWRPKRHEFTLAAGLLAPVGGDTLHGYRADTGGGQFGMDTSVGPYPRATSLRTHGTFARRRGRLWYRADTGVDIVVDTHGDKDLQLTSSSHMLLRAAAAIGMTTTRFFMSGQIRARTSVVGERTLINASLSTEFHSHSIRPALIVYLPLVGTQSRPGAALSLTYDLD